MKIALITKYENYPGGVESVNNILCAIFREVGHSVDLVTTDCFSSSFCFKIMSKIIGMPCITAKRFRLVKNNYDLVIANGEFGWGINHPKTINVFHGSYKGYRDSLSRQWSLKEYLWLTKEAFFQRIAARKKHVVAVSEYVRQILADDNITVHQVISNAVDIDHFKPNNAIEQKGGYLFVGGYNYYAKGFDVLESLADKGLVVDCVTNKIPSDKLGWIQNIDNERMPQIYNRYSILVFPSRFEGMPMVPLEAMACGLPIVMSNVGLGPELKREISEFVVDEYDAEEYLRKIRYIEANYNLFSRKARAYVEQHHAFANYKKEWLMLIERIAHA